MDDFLEWEGALVVLGIHRVAEGAEDVEDVEGAEGAELADQDMLNFGPGEDQVEARKNAEGHQGEGRNQVPWE